MGFWRTLDDVAGGKTISQSRDGQAAAQAAAQRKQQVQGLLDMVAPPGDAAANEKRLLLMTNLDAYTNAQAKNYEPANVSGGDSRVFGNARPAYTAPKLSMDGGVPVTQTATGTSFGQPRPMGLVEQAKVTDEVADNSRADAAQAAQISQFAKTFGLDEQKVAELVRSNKAREGIGWHNAMKPPSGGINIYGGSVGPTLPGSADDYEDAP